MSFQPKKKEKEKKGKLSTAISSLKYNKIKMKEWIIIYIWWKTACNGKMNLNFINFLFHSMIWDLTINILLNTSVFSPKCIIITTRYPFHLCSVLADIHLTMNIHMIPHNIIQNIWHWYIHSWLSNSIAILLVQLILLMYKGQQNFTYNNTSPRTSHYIGNFIINMK